MAERLIGIEPVARDYAWGSRTAIAQLLGQPPSSTPVAELWFGAHPDSPSTTEQGRLDALIDADPVAELGADAVAAFGPRLPFLVKILAAEHALSIQVHPTLAQAQAGFADEQARGIPADAPNRNYRDANHKPELLCALTDFDALCGFRPPARTLELLAALGTPALAPLQERLTGADPLRAAMRWLLDLERADCIALLAEVLPACRRLAAAGNGWSREAQVVLQAAADFPDDIGAVIALLLNAVRLQPGEAIFLGAGTVHAYLRGLGVEVMANSDNVVRCGLTPKHIDVDEVMRIADFIQLGQPRLTPTRPAPGQLTYPVPVPDFELSILDLAGQRGPLELRTTGPQILLCTEGEVDVDGLSLRPGQAVFAAAGRSAPVRGVGRVFRATTGRAAIAAMS